MSQYSYRSKSQSAMLIAAIIFFILLLRAALCPAEVHINIKRIIWIESKGNPLANGWGGARGLCQITPVVLKEYNQFNKTKYKLKDLYKPNTNIKIAKWYLTKRIPQMIRAYKKPVTIDNIIIAYNAGISYVAKGKRPPRITRRYIRRYKK